jgi:hypothetical protein
VRAIKLWIWVVDAAIWCLLWIAKNPWKSTKTATNILFRLATVLSVGYLVYDRVYETVATITSPASDPNHPFMFPFAITNSSHLFTFRNISWFCDAIHIKADIGTVIDNIGIISGTANEILPGQSLNIYCDPAGPILRLIHRSEKILEACIAIRLRYDVDVYYVIGHYLSSRFPAPTTFTWFPHATSPQWIRGEFAKENVIPSDDHGNCPS